VGCTNAISLHFHESRRMTEFVHPTCATNVERRLVDVGEVP
jgi:hypothetical protein